MRNRADIIRFGDSILPSPQITNVVPFEPILFDCVDPSFFIFIQAYAKNIKTFALIFFVKLYDIGIFSATRATPACPELHKHRFSCERLWIGVLLAQRRYWQRRQIHYHGLIFGLHRQAKAQTG